MQTPWIHIDISGEGYARWLFSGTTAASSAYLSQPLDLKIGEYYRLNIQAMVRELAPNLVDEVTGNIIVCSSVNGSSKNVLLTIPINEGILDIEINETIVFESPADTNSIEVFAEVTSVSQDSDLDVIVGSVSIGSQAIHPDSECIGVIRSTRDDIHYLFFCNPDPDHNAIVKIDGDMVSIVIRYSGLDFSNLKSRRINGGGIAGDLLYFTDGGTEPKCVHLEDYNLEPPVNEEEILLIKRGPHLAPTFQKFTTGPSLEVLNQSLINDFNFQFAYHYEYKDKQVSVLSPYSTLCSRSNKDEDYRRVRILIPAGEQIPERVEKVIFSARVGNNGPWFEIARIDTPVTNRFIDFYNNTNGNLLDPFQNLSSSLVPRRCKSMAIAKSRLWVGGNLEGYNTPENIDLSFSTIESTPAGPQNFGIYKIKQRAWFYVYDPIGGGSGWFFVDLYLSGPTFSEFFIYTGTDWTNRNGVAYSVPYDPMVVETLDIIPPSQSIPPDQTRPVYSIIDPSTWNYSEYSLEYQGQDRLVNFITAQAGQKTFPSNSSYKGGIVFSDGKGRKSGVYTDDSMVVNTTTDKTDQIRIRWDLANSIGIPDWAEYYSIVMTRNLKKSMFIEDSCLDAEYYREDENGDDNSDYISNARFPFIRVNIANLVNAGLGYSFVLGDRIFIRDINGGDQDLEITDFDGIYVTARLNESLGNLTALQEYYYEIYRPITSSGAGLLFYETANVYPIVNGAFSTLTGFIEGDSINVSRPLFVLSGSPLKITASGPSRIYAAMSVDSNEWVTSIGRPFIETLIGEVDKVAYFRHSGTFIAGTGLNSLSDFDSGDEGNIPIESGSVVRLQPTDKESTEGDVILAFSESDTFSIYVDESRLTAGTSSFMIGATKVIGDVRKQKSGFGTVHPESVFEYEGYVYFYDKLSRAFCRYATNGIFPISENKTVRHFEEQSALNTETDVVVSGYDPFYKVVFVTFTNATTSTKKTVAYSVTKDRWISFFDFAPDLYFTGSKSLYSVVGAKIYAHDDSVNYNRFYETDFFLEITSSFNQSPATPKEWKAISLGVSPNLYEFLNGDQSVIANGLELTLSNEQGQLTNIMHSELAVDENIVYGEIRGDLNTGGVLTGDPMFSPILQLKIKMLYGAHKFLIWAKAGVEMSRGHVL